MRSSISLDALMQAFAKLPMGQERRELFQTTLHDPALAFNALNRDAELFTPGEKLSLCRCAFGFISNQTTDSKSIPRVRVLLNVSWMLSKGLRKQLIEFISAKPAEAFDLLRNPPNGMTFKGYERALLINAIRCCPATSYKVLRNGSKTRANGDLHLKTDEIRQLALSAVASVEKEKVLHLIREKQLLPWRMLRQLAKAA